MYELLGVTFDTYAGESFYNDKMGRVIDELKAKGLLNDRSEGAIDRGSGALRHAPVPDPAAATARRCTPPATLPRPCTGTDTYHFDKCLYVVAYQQDLHFRQLVQGAGADGLRLGQGLRSTWPSA